MRTCLQNIISHFCKMKITAWCLLLLIGVITKAQQLQVGVETISIAFVLPNRNLTTANVRKQLRQHFNIDQPFQNIFYRLQVNPVYVTGLSVNDAVKSVFCSPTAEGINAVFVLVDKSVQGSAGTQIANMIDMLANAAGMPTLLWSSNAFELEADNTRSGLFLPQQGSQRFLLAPSIRSQARAVYAFLQSHPWQKFSLILSLQTPGFKTFAEEMHRLSETEHRKTVSSERRSAFVHEQHLTSSRLLRTVELDLNWKKTLRAKLIYIRDNAKTRFIVLYVNKEEASEIFAEARTLGMTSAQYSWVCAKSVLGDDELASQAIAFAPGTVVATYEVSYEAQLAALKGAAYIWSNSVQRLIASPWGKIGKLSPTGICDSRLDKNWPAKADFIELIRQTKVPSFDGESDSSYKFDETGTLEIGKIVLLDLDKKRNWAVFGEWTDQNGLVMKKPEIFHVFEEAAEADLAVLRIVTLKEQPYINYEPAGPVTNSCPRTAVPCKLSPLTHFQHTSFTSNTMEISVVSPTFKAMQHNMNDSWACCTGFCVDLLRRLASDVGFRFHLYEVTDRKWGSISKGEWNGLVQALVNGEADMALTSLKINRDRNEAIEFSVPYLETGIATLVSVREVGTSATAFLEPFSPDTWFVILVGLINICAISMFVFEYLSIILRAKWDRDQNPCQFSPFSSLWLSWSMLFKAVVKVDLPKSLGAKLIACVWGMFCVIFASSYMANLAVFMISKEEFHDFSGLEDRRFQNPHTKNPPWRFATINHGATEIFLRQNYPDMFDYMKQYNTKTMSDGAEAVRNGTLDAFIYDAKPLEYKAGHDEDCKLRTVGKWYATTGYGIGFPKGSRWVHIFDKFIIDYQHSGFIQQLSDFWLTGDCQRYKTQELHKSYRLGVINFTSAFVLLFFGVSICLLLLIAENLFSKYIRQMCSAGRGSFLWDRLLQRLNIRFVSSQWQTNKDIFPPPVVRSCANCGGRGHFIYQCSSPDMQKAYRTYLDVVESRNVPKNNARPENYGSLLHIPEVPDQGNNKVRARRCYFCEVEATS